MSDADEVGPSAPARPLLSAGPAAPPVCRASSHRRSRHPRRFALADPIRLSPCTAGSRRREGSGRGRGGAGRGCAAPRAPKTSPLMSCQGWCKTRVVRVSTSLPAAIGVRQPVSANPMLEPLRNPSTGLTRNNDRRQSPVRQFEVGVPGAQLCRRRRVQLLNLSSTWGRMAVLGIGPERTGGGEKNRVFVQIECDGCGRVPQLPASSGARPGGRRRLLAKPKTHRPSRSSGTCRARASARWTNSRVRRRRSPSIRWRRRVTPTRPADWRSSTASTGSMSRPRGRSAYPSSSPRRRFLKPTAGPHASSGWPTPSAASLTWRGRFRGRAASCAPVAERPPVGLSPTGFAQPPPSSMDHTCALSAGLA